VYSEFLRHSHHPRDQRNLYRRLGWSGSAARRIANAHTDRYSYCNRYRDAATSNTNSKTYTDAKAAPEPAAATPDSEVIR
jgi:hypothetical protein